MYSVLDIDRKTTNEVAIAFKHAMCQVQLNIVDQNGKKIQFGTGNGKVSSIKLTQPAEVKYNIYKGQPVEIGAMQEMDFDISAAAYVVPGGKNYQFNAVYKNTEGKDIMYTYDFEVALVRNKKYLVDLRMDTEEESVLNVSVSVEEWDVEEIEAELIKDEEETTDDFMEFVEIPAGDFMMGSPEEQYGAWANEKPQHHVNISAFKMGKYEVTFDQYDKFCEETGAEKMDDNGWGRGDRPVIFVNWKEANEFCEWLGKKLGATVRLPTEAEWEYACRAGSTTKFFWGNNENGYDDYAWCSSNLGWRGPTQPVGQKKPNAFGLYDICGNVEEWCSDWASWNYNWAPKESTDPTGPEKPITDDDGVFYQKVYRGGCYYKSSGTLYSSKRGSNTPEPEIRQSTVGFRVVMDIDSATPVNPEKPHEIYKQGDAVPSGVYVAYMKEGIKYASKDYSGEGIFGALVSDGNHKMIVSPKNIESKKSWQFPADLLIDGVYTTDEDKDWDEQLEDAKTEFNGESNTNIIIEWKNTDHRNLADASVESVLFEYNGVSNWYLPSVGEFQYVMDNLEEVNKVLAKIEGYEELESQMTYWLSTQYSFLFAWIWDAFNGLTVSEKYNDYWVRPFCSFDVD